MTEIDLRLECLKVGLRLAVERNGSSNLAEKLIEFALDGQRIRDDAKDFSSYTISPLPDFKTLNDCVFFEAFSEFRSRFDHNHPQLMQWCEEADRRNKLRVEQHERAAAVTRLAGLQGASGSVH